MHILTFIINAKLPNLPDFTTIDAYHSVEGSKLLGFPIELVLGSVNTHTILAQLS